MWTEATARLAIVFSVFATLFGGEPVAAAQPQRELARAARLAGEAEGLMNSGRLDEAEKRAQSALELAEQQLGPQDPRIAPFAQVLLIIYSQAGEQKAAASLGTRVLELTASAHGRKSIEFATALNSLEIIYRQMGAYERAAPLAEQSLAILEERLGPEHPTIAAALDNLAGVYQDMGNTLRAERAYLRSVAIREKVGDAYGLSKSLFNLTTLYADVNDAERAEATGERTVSQLVRLFGSEHPAVAAALQSLGTVYYQFGIAERAEAAYKRALAIRETALGRDHPEVASSLNALGELYDDGGEFAKAEPLLARALDIRERSLGFDHPLVGNTLINLAYVESARGNFASAEARVLRAIRILESAFGEDHPRVASAQGSLSEIYAENGDDARALRALMKDSDTRERSTVRRLTAGSEAQKRQLLTTYSGEMVTSVALALRSDDVDASRLAMTEVLRHKARALSAMADVLQSVRRTLSGANSQALDELQRVRTELATRGVSAMRGGSQTQAELERLSRREQELEESLSVASTAYAAALAPVTLDGIQQALPHDTALVEWSYYRPPPRKGTRRRYDAPARIAAGILLSSGAPSWVDLGEASSIASAVSALRSGLSSPARDAKPAARDLESLVFAPIRARLGTTRTVFLAPDGVLSLVPYGALVDETGHYLIENWHLSYLTSGRDLLRFREHDPARSSSLVVADPAFERPRPTPPTTRSGATTLPPGARAFDLGDARFTSLPGTAQEARLVSKELESARVLTGAAASEAAVKRERGPLVLHIATHAFFIPLTQQPQKSRGIQGENGAEPRLPTNPLLRSGLALAGANDASTGNEDGLLTALEVSSLDLTGTKLVVLSACETGLGDLTLGEGVQGLRRALALSGAETQILSLWDVDDAATRELMGGYYEGLRRGEGRAQALQHAQLALMANPAHAHPNYWAAFLASGDPTPLQLAHAQNLAKVAPRAHGCACSAAGATGRGEGQLALMLCGAIICAAVLARRGRRAAKIGLVFDEMPPVHDSLC